MSYSPLPHLTPLKGYPIVDVFGWKIYYTDRSIVSSRDSNWEEAPKQKVQFVVLYFDKLSLSGQHCRYNMTGYDYYFKGPEGFGYSFDDVSYVKGDVIYGEWTSKENYDLICSLASKDTEI